MAWWPFARRKSKSKKSELVEHKPVLDEKRRSTTTASTRNNRLSRTVSPTSARGATIGAIPYEQQTSGPPPVISSSPVKQSTAPRPPIHSSREEPTYVPPPELPELQQSPPLPQSPPERSPAFQSQPQPSPSKPSPPQPSPAKQSLPKQSPPRTPPLSSPKSPTSPGARPGRKGSEEDITALPASPRKFDPSPHLRTVPESETNIIAGSANEAGLTKRRSVKKRDDDSNRREEQGRLVSSPIPIPQRTGRDSPSLFKRDSKRLRSDLSKPNHDPTSSTSLAGPPSGRTSMTGMSETHRFDLVDMLSPRPRFRFSLYGQHAPSTIRSDAPSRANSKKELPSVSHRELRESKTVADLADGMDPSSIRELMERDQRRRDRKRKTDDDRARRKLDRLAARGEKEGKARARREDKEMEMAATAGPSGIVRSYPSEIHPALRVVQQDEYADEPVSDPFADPPAVVIADVVVDDTADDTADVPLEMSRQAEEGPFADPAEDVAENAPISPPDSPVQDVQDSSDLPEPTELPGQTPKDTTETSEPIKAEAEPTKGKASGLAALFRRSIGGSKRSTSDKARDAQSESSFSNASRESMSKQQASAQQTTSDRTYRRSSSGTPVRTRSKFQEDLPEYLMSPPDSRLQSPEVGEGEAVPPLPTESGQPSEGGPVPPLPTESGQPSEGVPVPPVPTDSEQASEGVSVPVPVPAPAPETAESEAAPSAAVLSQSLASVDSEGSWLSGRPRKRTSQQLSISRPETVQRVPSTMTTSTEDYFTPAEEYPSATMTPGGFFSVASERSYQDDIETPVEPGSEEPQEPLVQGQVARTPTVVLRQPRVQSSAGMLGDFDDTTQEYGRARSEKAGYDSSRDPSPGPGSEYEEATIEEATIGEAMPGTDVTQTQQASHARQISAGSARLLDIPPKRDSANLNNIANM